jgi:hypothetical protein
VGTPSRVLSTSAISLVRVPRALVPYVERCIFDRVPRRNGGGWWRKLRALVTESLPGAHTSGGRPLACNAISPRA